VTPTGNKTSNREMEGGAKKGGRATYSIDLHEKGGRKERREPSLLPGRSEREAGQSYRGLQERGWAGQASFPIRGRRR